jgi:hypothetical protein
MNLVPLPGVDFAGYLCIYTDQMVVGDEEPAAVVDRYHTPDIEWISDGNRLDRARLIAHVAPVRRNACSASVDVHEVVVAGERLAARYTLRATLRRGREVEIDSYLFGTLAADGRLRRVDQITRTLPEPADVARGGGVPGRTG